MYVAVPPLVVAHDRRRPPRTAHGIVQITALTQNWFRSQRYAICSMQSMVESSLESVKIYQRRCNHGFERS